VQWREVERAGGTGSIGQDGGGGRCGVERVGGQAGRVGSNERCGVGRAGRTGTWGRT
jgi:hypothetical protein